MPSDKTSEIEDLGAASEVTLGFEGSPYEAVTLPDRQDTKP